MSKTLALIEQKIAAGTVTTEDFNQLINEVLPSAGIERVRRRTRRAATDSHIDPEGHQPLEPNHSIDARVNPKHHTDQGKSQMLHRGTVGHNTSTRTQRRRAKSRFDEAVAYLEANIGKEDYDLSAVQDPQALLALTARLLREGWTNRDWLYTLHQQLLDANDRP